MRTAGQSGSGFSSGVVGVVGVVGVAEPSPVAVVSVGRTGAGFAPPHDNTNAAATMWSERMRD
jgi:hypothetical protein